MSLITTQNKNGSAEGVSQSPSGAIYTIDPATKKYLHADDDDTTPRKNGLVVALCCLAAMVLLTAGASICGIAAAMPPHVQRVEFANELNEDGSQTITVYPEGSLLSSGELWCLLAEGGEGKPAADDERWQLCVDGSCDFDVTDCDFEIYVRDEQGKVGEGYDKDIGLCRIVSVELDWPRLYLPLEGTQSLECNVVTFGDADGSVEWTSSDDSIATVKDGQVTGHKNGSCTVTATAADGTAVTADVLVTDLITVPNWNTSEKELLDYRYVPRYTEEEAALLDEILANRVERAGGANTRGGVVAAARFLTLEFPYKIAYFFENGRLSPHAGRPRCDGEGRFYHKGLYLTESKYDVLDPTAIRYGPSTWGELLSNWETKYAFVAGNKYPNGLDCSGFVSWCLINGGADVGDKGAGDESGNNDLCDLGEKQWLTVDYIQSDEPQVGDLIAEDGHIAIIIGMTDDEIWIGESLFTNVRVTHFKRNASVRASGLYTYVIPMDGVYDSDGNFTEMWTELGWPESEN